MRLARRTLGVALSALRSEPTGSGWRPSTMSDAVNPRLRRAIPILAAVAVVGLAVTIPVWASSGAGRSASGLSASELSSVEPVAAPVTAAMLAHYHWTELPPAPIAARTGAAAAWTGSQMLVWGGASGPDEDALQADGAAYSPSSNSWSVLPKAPIDARTNMASVWTGAEWFVWGGLDELNQSGSHATDDGALYDPAARTWRKVAKSPLAARRDAQAFWLDGKVIVLGGEPAVQSQDQYLYTDMASYDPGANAWKKLAPLPATKNHQVLLVVAVATGNRLYAWQGWVQSEPTADGTTTYYGIELDIYDPQSNNWTVDHAASRGSGNTNNDSPDSLVGAVWTGSSIITPASQLFCGMCPGPYANGLQSRMLDVATNTWTKLPHGPTDDLMPTSLWTGGALLSFNTTTTTSGPGGNHLPGEAAAFDPASDRWTSLPSAPLAGDVVAVWAGGRLLEWGSMSVPSNAEAGAAPATRTAGLSFGP